MFIDGQSATFHDMVGNGLQCEDAEHGFDVLCRAQNDTVGMLGLPVPVLTIDHS